MRSVRTRTVSLLLSLAMGGTCLQLGACNLEGIVGFAQSFNPCGTILACDPATYRFVMADITGPGVQPDLDPFCTWPPLCDAGVDPIFGGVGALP